MLLSVLLFAIKKRISFFLSMNSLKSAAAICNYRTSTNCFIYTLVWYNGQGCRGDVISIPIPTRHPYPWGSPYPPDTHTHGDPHTHPIPIPMGIPIPTPESRAAVGTEFLSPFPPHTHTHTHGDPHGDPFTHGRPDNGSTTIIKKRFLALCVN